MPKEPLTIIVNDREARASRVADLLDENPEAQVIRKRLRTGDYLVEGRILVERKRIPDFLGSLCDGRHFVRRSRRQPFRTRLGISLEGNELSLFGSEARSCGGHKAVNFA